MTICSLASFCRLAHTHNENSTNKKKVEDEQMKKEQVFFSSMTFIVYIHFGYAIVYQNILKFSACVVLFPFVGFEEMTIVRFFRRRCCCCLRIINAPLCAIQIKVYT